MTVPLGIDEWIGVLRAVAVMMTHGDPAILTLEQALADQEDPKRFRITMEGDSATLIHTMTELAARYGAPPGRRPIELSPERRCRQGGASRIQDELLRKPWPPAKRDLPARCVKFAQRACRISHPA